ncbi:DNA/RNA polymerase [Pisolithus microcarpus]|nr:DNA/RNA polymerase [Pisolithus microcarpus]
MIPRTSARRLETTLLSYSRQRLPRPHRLYSTPSKKTNSPASAFAQVQVPRPSFPAYLYGDSVVGDTGGSGSGSSAFSDMQGFLKRGTPYTILPSPLPIDRASSANSFLFPDSPTQDQLAVMHACLHSLYDVPRAKQVFERLRRSPSAEHLLDARVYNSFLEAYVEVATTKEPNDRSLWIEDAWQLYHVMENGAEKVQPTPQTYAIMLLAWLRFNSASEKPVHLASALNPSKLLSNLITRGLSPTAVITDRVISSSSEASQIIQLLSKSAVDMNLSRVVTELGQAEAIGCQLPDPLENVPEVNPVMKLKTLPDATSEEGAPVPEAPVREVPFNLNNLRKHLAKVSLARRVLPEDVAARQKLLEESAYDVAVERLKHESQIFDELGLTNPSLRRAGLQRWMWDWYQKLSAHLELEIANIVATESKQSKPCPEKQLAPFLALIKPEKLSLITILEVMRLHGSGGVNDGMKTARALLAVGRAVENEYKAEMCKRNNIAIPAHARAGGDHGYFSGLGYRDLHARRVTAAKYMEDSEEWTSEWTQVLRVRMGSVLVDSLMKVATVERVAVDKNTEQEVREEQSAFCHSYEFVRGQKLGVIRLNPVVTERLAKDDLRETLHPRHLPMLVKPKPWLGPEEGGYFYNRSFVMRFKDSAEQQTYLEHATTLGNVELVYAGLDVLGSTPWKINRHIFDVVLEVWNSGERLCKIPPVVFDKPQPEKPENYHTDIKARSVYSQRLRAYQQDKANNHSDRCSVNYKIEIARAFLGDVFYLPHNLDFRGRAYPIPPHLNHIGDDLSRGLLMFAEAKPLGERGLRWLKIHLANLYGFDKGSFDERVAFVMNHLDDIYDSAERPLEGRRWWTTAGDPWQCLSTCMELRAALESGDPEGYMSTLPIHQDGTCNGLQHYAALGGDREGAAQVNLAATDRPSDVYTYVANMVNQVVEEDAAKGDRVAQMLVGKISRKVVKQTVMTTVYGVTYIGARDQIERQLKDRGDIPEEECWATSSYLARKVLYCIGDLFAGAKAIQTWLNLCARLISKSIPGDRLEEAIQREQQKDGSSLNVLSRIRKEQMAAVVWTTPLGLPIVQPYRKTKRKQIMTALQTVYISDPNSPAEVNGVKQASAFPPNFIHSLDATHMMLTALECRTRGIVFASVHDSYWTHACSIDQMSAIIRDTFIALHSSDILGKLEAEFKARYADYKVPLASLRVGTFLKKLKMAGVRIVASPEEAAAIKSIHTSTFDPLIDVSETAASSITSPSSCPSNSNSKLTPPSDSNVNNTPKKRLTRRRAPSRRPAGVENEESEAEEEESIDADMLLADKFIGLPALIPPLPKKGDFQVETIKKSLYFFS